MTTPTIHLHQGDLPANITFKGDIAVDCEMTGLGMLRDRLCLVQLRGKNGDVHLVKIAKGQTSAPNLKAALETSAIKILQYARIDMAFLRKDLGIDMQPVYCTKIASKLVRTYTEKHGLKNLIKEYLSIETTKEEQTTDWAADNLTEGQLAYAASDVLYLHDLKAKLVAHVAREKRCDAAQACFNFLPTRALLDTQGWEHEDFFAHGVTPLTSHKSF